VNDEQTKRLSKSTRTRLVLYCYSTKWDL